MGNGRNEKLGKQKGRVGKHKGLSGNGPITIRLHPGVQKALELAGFEAEGDEYVIGRDRESQERYRRFSEYLKGVASGKIPFRPLVGRVKRQEMAK